MSIQIATNLVAGQFPYKADKSIVINPPTEIHPYISVVILRRDEVNPGKYVNYYYVYQQGLNNEAIEFTPPHSGCIYITAMLLPYFVALGKDESENPFYQFIIGPEIDNTDSDKLKAAVVNMILYGQQQNDPVKGYKGGPLLDFNPPGIGSNLVSYSSDAIFWNGPDFGTVKSVGFRIVNEQSKKMIESNVSIHLFDGTGELLGLVDTNENQSSAYNVPPNFPIGKDVFQFAAFINCQRSFDSFIFSVGDPLTDARVSITEVD